MTKNKILKDFSEEGEYNTVKKCKCWGDAIDAATEGLEELMSRGYSVSSFFIEESIAVENEYDIIIKGSKMGGGIFLNGMKVKKSEE